MCSVHIRLPQAEPEKLEGTFLCTLKLQKNVWFYQKGKIYTARFKTRELTSWLQKGEVGYKKQKQKGEEQQVEEVQERAGKNS